MIDFEAAPIWATLFRTMDRPGKNGRMLLDRFGAKSTVAAKTVAALFGHLQLESEPGDGLRLRHIGGISKNKPARAVLEMFPDAGADMFRRAADIYISVIAEICSLWALTHGSGKFPGTLEALSSPPADLQQIESLDTLGALATEGDKRIHRFIGKALETVAQFDASLPNDASDMFGLLYVELVPAKMRHAGGEHYTPDWLADLTLDRAGYDGNPDGKLLDPSCGSGVFLVRAAARLRGRCKALGFSPEEQVASICRNLSGFDTNPVAVKTARANMLMAMADLLPKSGTMISPAVFMFDSILGWINGRAIPEGLDEFDYVVGNPPWVNWEGLSDEFRRASMVLWHGHGLFPHSGMDTLLGKSKKDLSMLMTYEVMEKYLVPGGVLAFVITRAVVKSSGSGQGFRRFRLGDGTPIRPIGVDDVSALRPFGKVASAPVILCLKKGGEVEYPAPYRVWTDDGMTINKLGRPVDRNDDTSPWIVARPAALSAFRKIMGQSSYEARAGIYSGGANGVYWVRVIERREDGLWEVENIPESGKAKIDKIRFTVESELLYPLLRPSDIGRWASKPSVWTIVVQDPTKRRGMDESELRDRFPHAAAYLGRFEWLLRRRASFKRFFTRKSGGRVIDTGPYYSMFAVGKYTFSPCKVVWPRMATRLDAAVVESIDGKNVLPQETVTFIPLDDPGEAHYVCAMLNSTVVEAAARAYSQVGGKGFASPHLMKYINIPKFDGSSMLHVKLSGISRRAHAGRNGKTKEYSGLQDELDSLATEVYGLDESEFRAVMDELKDDGNHA